MIRHILVPLDSLSAQHSALLTAWRNFPFAEIELLHALRMQVDGFLPMAPMGAYVPSPTHSLVDEELKAEARAALHTLGHGKVVLSSSPASEILKAAASGQFDLIVMGSSGKIGLERLLLGSVAETVIRESPIPVMTVRTPSAGEQVPNGAFRKALLLTDLSPCSQQAEAFIQRTFPTVDVQCLHVVSDETGKISPFARKDDLLSEAKERMAEHGEGEVALGSPAQVLLDRATQESCDLIVIGTEPRGNLERFLIGSVAGQVIHEAKIPVLVARQFPAKNPSDSPQAGVEAEILATLQAGA